MAYGSLTKMSEQERWIWLAALLEGEGTFTENESGSSLRISLGMTDKDTVNTAARIMSNHCWPKARPVPGHKTMFHIEISGERAAIVAGKILPYMHTRRRQRIAGILRKWFKKIMNHYGITCRRCGAVDPTYRKNHQIKPRGRRIAIP